MSSNSSCNYLLNKYVSRIGNKWIHNMVFNLIVWHFMKDGGWWSSLRNSWIPFSTTLHCCTSKPKTQGKNARNPSFSRYDTIRIMKRNKHLKLHIVIICIVVYCLRLINYIYSCIGCILRHLKSWIMAYHHPFRNKLTTPIRRGTALSGPSLGSSDSTNVSITVSLNNPEKEIIPQYAQETQKVC